MSNISFWIIELLTGKISLLSSKKENQKWNFSCTDTKLFSFFGSINTKSIANNRAEVMKEKNKQKERNPLLSKIFLLWGN